MDDNLPAPLWQLHREIVGDARFAAAVSRARESGACFVSANGNAGDGLIHLGAYSLLRTMNWSPRVISEWELAQKSDGACAVLVGGAMIEGVWEERMRVIRSFLDRGGRLIILPCTAFGFQEVFGKYSKQLVIFAREKKTLENARDAGVEDVSLCHDLAFAVNSSFYDGLCNPNSKGQLFAYRTDDERCQADIPLGKS